MRKSTDSKGKSSWVFDAPYNPGTGTEFTGELNGMGTRATGTVCYSFAKDAEAENFCEFHDGFTATK